MGQAAVGGGLPRFCFVVAAAALMLSLACACRGGAWESDAAPEVGPDVAIVPLACRNGNKDVGETDVDCGGNSCGPCAANRKCTANDDCASGTCTSGNCD